MEKFLILFAFLATFSYTVHSALVYSCPSEDIQAPCDCIPAFGQVFFECSNAQNKDQLFLSAKPMAGRAITSFKLSDSAVSYVPHDLFKNSSLMRMQVKHSTLFYLFNREVEGEMANLEELALDSVRFNGGLDWTVLGNLKRLRILSVYKCNLEKISEEMSEMDLPVETLILSNNGIGSVHPYAFSKLKELKNLKLDHNEIGSLSRSAFVAPESGLQFLDLSFNKLSALPEDIFAGMTELNSLILKGNVFSVLERRYMQSIFSSLLYLDVNDNPLKCDCELTWVLSESRPFHFFGFCSQEDANTNKNLRELSRQDFIACEETQ